MNQLTIYGTSASRAIRPLWTACELAIDFQHLPQPYHGGATRNPAFLAINPNGHIPVLTDFGDGETITVWESMACSLYLSQTYGKADGVDLSPANRAEHAQALRWAFWTVTEIEVDALSSLMHRKAMPEAERRIALAEAAEKRLSAPLSVLEQHLSSQKACGSSYISGSRFTIADLCVASVLSWVRFADHEFWKAFRKCQAWLGECLGRIAYKRARALP